jgi:hypothetical protein
MGTNSMALLDLWKTNRDELGSKHIQQIISIAGEGKLLDGNSASTEFRELLANVPSSQLRQYAQQCLDSKFEGNGFALQDIMNQVAVRLGFQVEEGRYRGQQGHCGHDGLWTLNNGHSIVVEVKTTDTFSINLDTVAAYRKKLVSAAKAGKEETSLLLIVGRDDTGGLEAQIRGSRYAWDMRIISVEGLLRLMELRETLDDPSIVSRVSNILIPQEYTKLDGIIDVVFVTAEEAVAAETDVGSEDDPEVQGVVDTLSGKSGPKFRPSSFHEKCALRLEEHLDASLVKRSRTLYSTADGKTRAFIAVSKQHGCEEKGVYWFAFHPHQQEFFEGGEHAFVVLGCASAELLFVIPYAEIDKYLSKMWVTESEDRMYWHVKIEGREGQYSLLLKLGEENPDISSFMLAPNDFKNSSCKV